MYPANPAVMSAASRGAMSAHIGFAAKGCVSQYQSRPGEVINQFKILIVQVYLQDALCQSLWITLPNIAKTPHSRPLYAF